MMTVTPLYAGLLALLFLALSLNVVRGRILHRVSVGDGGDKDLQKRMRVQANWVEYAPIGIILIGLAELLGYGLWSIHVLGASLLAGRIIHAVGLGSTPQIVPLRWLGMFLTIGVVAVAAVLNIVCVVIRI